MTKYHIVQNIIWRSENATLTNTLNMRNILINSIIIYATERVFHILYIFPESPEEQTEKWSFLNDQYSSIFLLPNMFSCRQIKLIYYNGLRADAKHLSPIAILRDEGQQDGSAEMFNALRRQWPLDQKVASII